MNLPNSKVTNLVLRCMFVISILWLVFASRMFGIVFLSESITLSWCINLLVIPIWGGLLAMAICFGKERNQSEDEEYAVTIAVGFFLTVAATTINLGGMLSTITLCFTIKVLWMKCLSVATEEGLIRDIENYNEAIKSVELLFETAGDYTPSSEDVRKSIDCKKEKKAEKEDKLSRLQHPDRYRYHILVLSGCLSLMPALIIGVPQGLLLLLAGLLSVYVASLLVAIYRVIRICLSGVFSVIGFVKNSVETFFSRAASAVKEFLSLPQK